MARRKTRRSTRRYSTSAANRSSYGSKRKRYTKRKSSRGAKRTNQTIRIVIENPSPQLGANPFQKAETPGKARF